MEPSTVTMIMIDGTEVKMTLNFKLLRKLRDSGKYTELYTRYNAIRLRGLEDELDRVTVLYVGYLCANMDDLDNVMTEDEFEFLADPNRAILEDNYLSLMLPKAQAASATPSPVRPEAQAEAE